MDVERCPCHWGVTRCGFRTVSILVKGRSHALTWKLGTSQLGFLLVSLKPKTRVVAAVICNRIDLEKLAAIIY